MTAPLQAQATAAPDYISDLASDLAFMEAPDERKAQYLQQEYLPKRDPDFAAATPDRQQAYIQQRVFPVLKSAPVQLKYQAAVVPRGVGNVGKALMDYAWQVPGQIKGAVQQELATQQQNPGSVPWMDPRAGLAAIEGVRSLGQMPADLLAATQTAYTGKQHDPLYQLPSLTQAPLVGQALQQYQQEHPVYNFAAENAIPIDLLGTGGKMASNALKARTTAKQAAKKTAHMDAARSAGTQVMRGNVDDLKAAPGRAAGGRYLPENQAEAVRFLRGQVREAQAGRKQASVTPEKTYQKRQSAAQSQYERLIRVANDPQTPANIAQNSRKLADELKNRYTAKAEKHDLRNKIAGERKKIEAQKVKQAQESNKRLNEATQGKRNMELAQMRAEIKARAAKSAETTKQAAKGEQAGRQILAGIRKSAEKPEPKGKAEYQAPGKDEYARMAENAKNEQKTKAKPKDGQKQRPEKAQPKVDSGQKGGTGQQKEKVGPQEIKRVPGIEKVASHPEMKRRPEIGRAVSKAYNTGKTIKLEGRFEIHGESIYEHAPHDRPAAGETPLEWDITHPVSYSALEKTGDARTLTASAKNQEVRIEQAPKEGKTVRYNVLDADGNAINAEPQKLEKAKKMAAQYLRENAKPEDGTVSLRVLDRYGQIRSRKLYDSEAGSMINSVSVGEGKSPYRMVDTGELRADGSPVKMPYDTRTGELVEQVTPDDVMRTSAKEAAIGKMREIIDKVNRGERVNAAEVRQATSKMSIEEIENALDELPEKARRDLYEANNGEPC